MECLRLRVEDVDFSRNEIMVRDGKGATRWVTVLPRPLKAPVQEHLRKGKAVYDRDLDDGWGRVHLRDALDRKCLSTSKEWRWERVFPQEGRWENPIAGEEGRHHVHETLVQRAPRDAVGKAGTVTLLRCRTFGHSFARHPLPQGYDIRTLQEPPAQKDVRTTMTYTDVLNGGARAFEDLSTSCKSME